MSEETSSPSASALDAKTVALLLSKFEEQNLLIRQLQERVVQLEGRSSGAPSIASPIPVPPHGDMLAAFAKAHAESLASQSNAPSPSPSALLNRDASTSSPAFSPPPFGYPYGPYPGYYYPMHSPYPPPNWGAPPNHSSATAQPPNSIPAADVGDKQAAAAGNEQSSEVASGWGQPTRNGGPASSIAAVKSDPPNKSNSKSKKPCKFGDQCNRDNCWFDHPGGTKPDSQRNDAPDSAHLSSHSNNVASRQGDTSKAFGGSAKSKPACRNGENCTRTKCWFTHPAGWEPPGHVPEPTNDQDTPEPTDESTANQDWGVQDSGHGGWGTEQQDTATTESDNKWESWEVKPSNDWGTSLNDDWGVPSTSDWGTSTNDWASPAISSSVAPSNSASKSKKEPTASKSNIDKGKKRQKERATPPLQPASSQPTVLAQSETVEVAHEPEADTDLANELSVAEAIVDSLPTPALEPEHTSNSSSGLSEPENLSTPFAWGDEPIGNTVSDEQAAEKPTAQDTIAPSSMYESWGPVETSGWGSEELPDHSASPWDIGAQTSRTNQRGKGKGKQKEASQEKVVDDLDERDHTPTADAISLSSDAGADRDSKPIESKPPVPQGVPEDEIPDWLLGTTEDPYATLGISRPTTPKPASSALKQSPAPSRPRMSEMNGANFPPPAPDNNRQPPKTSVASGPTIRPRPTSWKIVSSGESSTAQRAQSGSSKESGKGSGKQSKKYYGPNKKQNAKGSK